MKIRELLKKERTISFEFFPPKTDEGYKELFLHIQNLEKLSPSFVSITYGAGGSTRAKTRDLVLKISKENKINVMAHLTCISHSKEEIIDILKDYKNNGIQNILALRGDFPQGETNHIDKGLKHSTDLIKIIKNNFDNFFSIGGAVYPEMHPESKNWDEEMKYLKLKKEMGMEFGITQLFFDNNRFYEFIDRCNKINLDIPILPGIMPISNYNQIKKFVSMCNASIPPKLNEKIEKYPEEVEKIGIEYAIHQVEDLIKNGVDGIHFYTLNKSKATILIYNEVKNLI
ncbi:MAG: methylenetetrahydrofolate reductase [NAD(P)H] [Brevinematales bacterium]|nr:methylenetetrahydrofolate reductase [NAD(P)H] [Brevinematales bacterium]